MSSQNFKDWESVTHIDPLILQHLKKKYNPPAVPQKDQIVKQRKLGVLYAAFLGVIAMIMVVLLGAIRCTDVDTILINSSRALLVYCTIGFVAGKIAEMCVRESAKSMIRNMLQRTDQLQNAAANEVADENGRND